VNQESHFKLSPISNLQYLLVSYLISPSVTVVRYFGLQYFESRYSSHRCYDFSKVGRRTAESSQKHCCNAVVERHCASVKVLRT
jgi:hypothetical protein